MDTQGSLGFNEASVKKVLRFLYGGTEDRDIVSYSYEQVMNAIEVLAKTIKTYNGVDDV